MLWLLALGGCHPLVGEYDARIAYDNLFWEAGERTEAPADPASLRVLTWNVKFGGGRVDFWFDGHGDRVHMTANEVDLHLDGLSALVRDLDPDVLLTQEVDIASKRSAYVDQVQGLLDRTDLNYAAWVPVWEADYIPEQGLGPMRMGQAVFSKYPITKNIRIDQGAIESQASLTRHFYLDRCIQRAHIDLGAQELVVLNNHPDAYSSDGTKADQIQLVVDEAASISELLVVGGDFNAVPDGTIQLDGFADDPAELEGRGIEIVNYHNDGDTMPAAFYDNYNAAVDLASYQAAASVEEQAPTFTHSIASDVFWTRKLDYLFTSSTWSGAQTLQGPGDDTDVDSMAWSDHAPLFAVLEVD
jgi:endonuclease/exonuclease/phosphatase family metal-dependent hydrolase